MKHPLAGDPVGFQWIFPRPGWKPSVGLFGGVIWGIGTVFNVVAGKIDQLPQFLTPLANRRRWWARCGAFLCGRNSRARDRAKLYLGLMFVFYALLHSDGGTVERISKKKRLLPFRGG